MDVASLVEVENELRSLGFEQLRQEKAEISRQLKIIDDQIGDLAFNNYRTYADAGRTTQDCTDIFTEMSDKLREVTSEIPTLQTEIKEFHTNSKTISAEVELIKAAEDKSNAIWEVLSLPARMDVCIRSGYYEAAYSLTNYGMLMQQHTMIKNPLIKNVSDRLVEARSLLLEELFNKFSGPLDLAASLQVVNNVRKMPYLTPTQLRVSILQHKDLYLEKQLIDIATHPDYALAAIDIYRTCMHDTLVLYLSVFPENESVKKDPSIDPRWEQWPTCSPSAVLGQWATRNISRLLDLIHRTEMKSGVDMASVWSKLMSLAATFGRMGLDFRPLIVHSLTGLIIERFRSCVKQATNRLVNDVNNLSIASGDFELPPTDGTSGGPPIPSSEISMWDDICIYGNDILNGLNAMRYSQTPMLVSSIMAIMRDSLKSILSWLSGFHASPSFARAVRILCLGLIPFLSQTIRYLFPYAVVARLFGSSILKNQYDQFTDFDVRELAASCDGSEKIEEVLLPLIQKKTLADIDIESVMRRDKFTSVFDGNPSQQEPSQVEEVVRDSIITPGQPSQLAQVEPLEESHEDFHTAIETPSQMGHVVEEDLQTAGNHPGERVTEEPSQLAPTEHHDDHPTPSQPSVSVDEDLHTAIETHSQLPADDHNRHGDHPSQLSPPELHDDLLTAIETPSQLAPPVERHMQEPTTNSSLSMESTAKSTSDISINLDSSSSAHTELHTAIPLYTDKTSCVTAASECSEVDRTSFGMDPSSSSISVLSQPPDDVIQQTTTTDDWNDNDEWGWHDKKD